MYRIATRRAAVLLTAALCAAALTGTQPVAAAPDGQPNWQLRWAASPRFEGLRAFEHSEDDRGASHPDYGKHITTEGDHYKFVMHTVDRDTSTDRQRNEVRGAVDPSGNTVTMLDGERWRFTYSAFIPDTLKATTSFSHIMQLKNPGTGFSPILVMSLRRWDGVQKLELRVYDGDRVVGATDLEPLQNHWIDIDLDVTIGDAPRGAVHWVVRDGFRTVLDASVTGVDTWLGDRVRPKWGIYRSLGDTSGSLQDTYMLIRKLRAYQWTSQVRAPHSVHYEAERASISGGAVQSDAGGYSGSGFVNYDDAAGSYVEWTVSSAHGGDAVLHLWYANATTIGRPMDITVNGVVVAHDLAFDRTPAWSDWETRTLITALRPGVNTIRATATTAAGGPNVDALEVQAP